ncbi:hypothetical protein V2G26_015657 [Clonostachys chloroleuca]
MAVPPPSEYRTLYDLPLLDEPEISTDRASVEFTEYSVSLYHLENLGDVQNDLPYGPQDFLAVLKQYYCIARQQHEALQEIRNIHPTAELELWPSETVVVFEDLRDQITVQLDRVASKIASIARHLGLSEDIESVPRVANISVRECRLWCQLNTTDFRQRLQSARGTTELHPTMNEISNMILGDVARAPAQGVFKVHKDKEDTSVVSPLVYFVCTGMDREGNQLHNLVHVGCTRERFPMWKPLQQHRNDARDDLLGREIINKWSKWRDQLVKLGVATTDATFRLRENLMQGNTEELPTWAHELVTTKLRACSNHVGQAFQQVDWNTIIEMGCLALPPFLCRGGYKWDL